MTAVSRVMLLLGALALAAAIAGGQQVRRTETGTVSADLIEYDFGANAFTATGNTRVTILGTHNAELRAPELTMDLSDQLNQILSVDATGPVYLEVLTAPDDEGLRRRIIARASAGAAYRQSTQTVVLSGQAVADVTTLPEGNVEAAHFEGQSIVVDLAKSTLTAREATIEVTTEVDVPEEQ